MFTNARYQKKQNKKLNNEQSNGNIKSAKIKK